MTANRIPTIIAFLIFFSLLLNPGNPGYYWVTFFPVYRVIAVLYRVQAGAVAYHDDFRGHQGVLEKALIGGPGKAQGGAYQNGQEDPGQPDKKQNDETAGNDKFPAFCCFDRFLYIIIGYIHK
jgi:hypothetical protein